MASSSLVVHVPSQLLVKRTIKSGSSGFATTVHAQYSNNRKTLPASLRLKAVNGSDQVAMVPQSVPVRVAHELLQAGHHFLDVRTVDEFNVGHADGAINVPYMLKIGSGVIKNPKFLNEVASVLRKDDEIIVGCQSGRKSLMAAAELAYAGFTGVTDIAGGYSAWLHNGLPQCRRNSL